LRHTLRILDALAIVVSLWVLLAVYLAHIRLWAQLPTVQSSIFGHALESLSFFYFLAGTH